MKVNNFIKNITERFNNVFKRFLFPCLYLCGVSLTLVVSIIIEYDKEDLVFIIMSLGLGLLASLLIDLFNEYFNKRLFSFLSLFVAGGSFALLHFYNDNQYVILGYVGVAALLFCLIAAVCYNKENQPNLCGYIVNKLFFCALLCSVLTSGICICVLAFQLLIKDFDDMEKVYMIVLSISQVAVCGILFLSYLPKKDEEITITSPYRIIVNKVALIVYFLLLVVLYMYLGKIIITSDMPTGRINWFASLALLFYCFFFLSCQSQQTGLEKFFCKFGGLLMLPILAMQGYAVYVRVSAYGLTPWRYLSLLFDLVGIIFIINSLVKYPVRYSIIAMAVIMLLSCVGPLNFLDVPFRQQNKVFENVLTKNNMLVDGKIVPSSSLSDEDKATIYSTYDFLYYADSNLYSLAKDIKWSQFESTFGFNPYNNEEYNYNDYVYCYFNPDCTSVDVSSYSTFEEYREYYNNEEDCYDELIKLCKQLNGMYDGDDNYHHEKIVYQYNGATYVVKYLSFTIADDDKLTSIDISAYKLY